MNADAAEDLGWGALVRPDRLPAAGILVGGLLLHSMNVLLTATTLPSIVRDIGGAAQISWPTTAYVAASIVAAASTAFLVAVVGAKRAFITGALVFGVGTLGCGLAPDMQLLVLGRLAQGFGGGLLTATAYVLVRNVFPKELWPRVFALLASVWSVSVLLGPLLGGAFATYGDWRWAFYTLAAVGGLIATLAAVAFPPVARADGPPPPPPLLRIGFVTAAIAAVSLAAVAASVAGKLGLMALGIALVVIMLKFDHAADRPMLPSDAFAFATPTGVGLWTALLMLIAFTPLQVYAPVFLQAIHGLDPLGAGYMVAIGSLFWTVAALLVAGLTDAWPRRLLVIGPLVLAAGLAATAKTMPLGSLLAVAPTLALIGAGIGMSWAFVAQRIMANARPGDEDPAAASVATVQQAGAAFGAAVAGAVANAAGFDGIGGEGAGETAAVVFAAAAGVALAAAVMGFRLKRLAP